jgi:hypothetical protein
MRDPALDKHTTLGTVSMEARKPLVVDVVMGLWFADRKRGGIRLSITRNSGTDASRDLVRKWSCCEVPETEFRSKTGSYWVVPVWATCWI